MMRALTLCAVLCFACAPAANAAGVSAEDMVANLLGTTAAPSPLAEIELPVLTSLPPITVEQIEPMAATTVTTEHKGPITVTTTVATNAEEEVRIDTTAAIVVVPADTTTVVGVEEALEEEAEDEKPPLMPGVIAGKIVDHKNRPLSDVKVVLFNDESYKEMLSTPGGNFGFNITDTNDFTLTATFENQFNFTNMFLIPATSYFVRVKFLLPVTVYGRLMIDDKPAQYGLFLRLIGDRGQQAGGIVLSNGLFRVKDITPGAYTMVFERRKRFIDRRITENRFYQIPLVLTGETVSITLEREHRSLLGQVILDGLPRRYVDALVILRDAKTDGKQIYREAHTYFKDGAFAFDELAIGEYTLQAVQSQREWKSQKVLVGLGYDDEVKRVVIDVATDPNAEQKRIMDLRKQFLSD